MTFEERMEALAARHEALAQTVELISIEIRELAVTSERNSRQIEENSAHINQLAKIALTTHESIKALLSTAEAHEHRIQHLEGRGQ